jgi:hypothetical protein
MFKKYSLAATAMLLQVVPRISQDKTLCQKSCRYITCVYVPFILPSMFLGSLHITHLRVSTICLRTRCCHVAQVDATSSGHRQRKYKVLSASPLQKMVKHFYKNEEKLHLLLSSVVIHTTYSIFNSGGACSGHVSATIVLLSCVLQSLFSPFSPLLRSTCRPQETARRPHPCFPSASDAAD